jgi:hypothetical protein
MRIADIMVRVRHQQQLGDFRHGFAPRRGDARNRYMQQC